MKIVWFLIIRLIIDFNSRFKQIKFLTKRKFLLNEKSLMNSCFLVSIDLVLHYSKMEQN